MTEKEEAALFEHLSWSPKIIDAHAYQKSIIFNYSGEHEHIVSLYYNSDHISINTSIPLPPFVKDDRTSLLELLEVTNDLNRRREYKYIVLSDTIDITYTIIAVDFSKIKNQIFDFCKNIDIAYNRLHSLHTI